MKKNISSLELYALENELQILNNAKVTQIYHPENEEVTIQFHVRGKGKTLVRIFPGKFLNITKSKETTLRPSGFCMQLRKYLSGSIVRKVYQQGSERIFVINFENKIGDKFVSYNMVIEFITKGTLIITDNDWNVITSMSYQEWDVRSIKTRNKYEFPTPKFDWKNSSFEEFKNVIQTSDKSNLATCLATEISLGGVSAEELCKEVKIDAKLLPTELKDNDIKKLMKGIEIFKKKIVKPNAFVYEKQVTPFELSDEKYLEKFETYSEGLDLLNPLQKTSPYEQKIKSSQAVIEQQEKAILDLENKIELNTKKGELVYEKYTALQKLLEIVKELKKTKTWAEISEELKKEKKIKSINLKNKKIIIDL